MKFAWLLGLFAVLLFVFAGAVQFGFFSASLLDGWTSASLAVVGILFAIAAAAVYGKENDEF